MSEQTYLPTTDYSLTKRLILKLTNTAATAHYLYPDALPHCSYITCTTSGPTVHVANGNIINPDLRATLKMSKKMSSKAQSAHIFNDITTGSPIFMGQLCEWQLHRHLHQILRKNIKTQPGRNHRFTWLHQWPVEHPTVTQTPRSTIIKTLLSEPSQRNSPPWYHQTRTRQILTSRSLQPHQVYFHLCHQQRQLHVMAWTFLKPYLQTSSTIILHRERPPQPRAK